jgi:hypothetical protein
MVEEHKYDYWWLGVKKKRKTIKTRGKRKTRIRKTRKCGKNKKI